MHIVFLDFHFCQDVFNIDYFGNDSSCILMPNSCHASPTAINGKSQLDNLKLSVWFYTRSTYWISWDVYDEFGGFQRIFWPNLSKSFSPKAYSRSFIAMEFWSFGVGWSSPVPWVGWSSPGYLPLTHASTLPQASHLSIWAIYKAGTMQ